MARDERSVTPQSEDFSAWYNEVVFKAELVDRGPVRGTMVIRPYGYRMWELLQADIDRRIKETGHVNAYFPLLIPESYLQREAEHVEGFAPELAVVTHAGGKELEEPLIVRPTSETIIGEMMAKWISSHRDLPLLLNQWANVRPLGDAAADVPAHHRVPVAGGSHRPRHEADAMRRDDARARLLPRTWPGTWRGHAGDRGREDARRAVRRGRADLHGRGDDAGRASAAVRHLALHGHELRQGLRHQYTAESGELELCHTTSWGMSARMIGGVIMTHGDDKGLVLPPLLAPYQVVIVPIGRGEQARASVGRGRWSWRPGCSDAGIRAHVDDRPQLSPGFKFNDWEMRGVPIRLELGPRDLAAGTALMGAVPAAGRGKKRSRWTRPRPGSAPS